MGFILFACVEFVDVLYVYIGSKCGTAFNINLKVIKETNKIIVKKYIYIFILFKKI